MELGAMHGVLLWADMNAATPLGAWGRSVYPLSGIIHIFYDLFCSPGALSNCPWFRPVAHTLTWIMPPIQCVWRYIYWPSIPVLYFPLNMKAMQQPYEYFRTLYRSVADRSHLDLSCAPYVLYGVEFIGPVPLALTPFSYSRPWLVSCALCFVWC